MEHGQQSKEFWKVVGADISQHGRMRSALHTNSNHKNPQILHLLQNSLGMISGSYGKRRIQVLGFDATLKEQVFERFLPDNQNRSRQNRNSEFKSR